jgi:ornithine cyclodeaminase/alanine dehydrogenase-like protein (mu-crystallin family)
VQLLTEADVRRLLDPVQVIAAIEEAFRTRYPTTLMPVRTQMQLAGGVFLIMPCYERSSHALGMKLVKVNENPKSLGDRIQATYILFDADSGTARLVIPANYLTDLRTAATSAVATKFLAREDARVLGIFGIGRQARAHLRVLPHVRKFQRAVVTGRDQGHAREFAQEISPELGMPVEAVYPRTNAAESDVLCTCTSSGAPLFDGRMLRPGTHLNLVGTFQPQSREVDDYTIQSARVVVDTFDGVLAEAGDLLLPLKSGAIGRDHLIADLHQLVSGKRAVRSSPSEITVFKSVGCALEDLAAAQMLEPA